MTDEAFPSGTLVPKRSQALNQAEGLCLPRKSSRQARQG